MFVIVAGAGLVGQQITRDLVKKGHDVVVIDISLEVCEQIYAETGAVTVNGNATRLRVLQESGASKADVLLCLMREDSDNIACATIAKSLDVPRILTRMRDPNYEQAYRLAGVTTIVRVADLLLNRLMIEIEQPEVREIMSLGGGTANVYAMRIPEDAACLGKTIMEIAGYDDFPDESLFMGIYRSEDESFHIPRGQQVLNANDTVFIIARPGDVKALTNILTRQRRGLFRKMIGKGRKESDRDPDRGQE